MQANLPEFTLDIAYKAVSKEFYESDEPYYICIENAFKEAEHGVDIRICKDEDEDIYGAIAFPLYKQDDGALSTDLQNVLLEFTFKEQA